MVLHLPVAITAYVTLVVPTVPYPFLTENPLEIRIAIYVVAALVAIMSFRLINSFHPTVTKQFRHDE